MILHKLLNLKCFKFTQNLGSNILSDLTSGSWPSLKPSPGWPIQNLPKNFSRTMLGSVPSPNLPRKKFAICPTSVPCPSDHLKLTSPLRGKDYFDTIDTQGIVTSEPWGPEYLRFPRAFCGEGWITYTYTKGILSIESVWPVALATDVMTAL